MSHVIGLRMPGRGVAAAGLLFLLAFVPAAVAQDDYAGPTPPRLSLVDGSVSWWAAGGDAWEAAPLNLPLAPGDFLAAAEASRFELQVGSRSFLRGAAGTELGLEFLDERRGRFVVNGGRATLDVRGDDLGSSLEIATTHGVLMIAAPGVFDLRVTADRTMVAAYDGGSATLRTRAGATVLVAGTEAVAGDAFPEPLRYDAPPQDDWLRWGRERSGRILAAKSRSWVADGIYGVEDLDAHGSWYDETDYGRVWVPLRVSAGWAPYTTGRWVYSGFYGWTWIDSSPWGWAPFHHGRWVRWRSRWAWAPGPVHVRPVYAPALVAFLTPPVGVVVGFDPVVSWVTLGWGEPVIPWWGPTWYRGRPCWTGWGGPTIIHDVHVHRYDRHRHPKHIHRYRYQDVPDAVAVVHRRDFERPRPQRMRLDREQVRRFRPGADGVPPPSRTHFRSDDPERLRAPGARPERNGPSRSMPGREPGSERRTVRPGSPPHLQAEPERDRPRATDRAPRPERERLDRENRVAPRQPRRPEGSSGERPVPRAPAPMAPAPRAPAPVAPPAVAPRAPERQRREAGPAGRPLQPREPQWRGPERSSPPAARPPRQEAPAMRPPRQQAPAMRVPRQDAPVMRMPRQDAPAMRPPAERPSRPQRPERQREREVQAPQRMRPDRDPGLRQDARPSGNRERVRAFVREQRPAAGRGDAGARTGEAVQDPR